jgi:hypothetical protein
VRPGSICLAEPAEGQPAFVLVVERLDNPEYVRYALLSNEVELRTDADFIVSREESGLPFELVVQCDLLGWVEVARLTAWGTVGEETLARVTIGEVGGRDARWGLPYVDGQRDPRWNWKLDQLAVAHRVSATAHARLTGL